MRFTLLVEFDTLRLDVSYLTLGCCAYESESDQLKSPGDLSNEKVDAQMYCNLRGSNLISVSKRCATESRIIMLQIVLSFSTGLWRHTGIFFEEFQ